MPLILSVEDKHPQFGNNCFIAPNATIVGNVIMGDDCSAWFNTVIRGDVNFIKMGNKVNVQDGACIHCTYQKYGTTIGNNVSIGHNAIVHGCTLHDNVLSVPFVILNKDFFHILNRIDAARLSPVGVSLIDLHFIAFLGPIGVLIFGVDK